MRPRLRGPRRTRETSAAAWKPNKQPCVLLCLDSRSQDRGSAAASPYLAEDQFDLENCSLASVFPHAVLGSIRPASWDFDDVGWVPSLPRAAKLPPPLRFPTSWTQVDVAQLAVTKAPSAHDAFTRASCHLSDRRATKFLRFSIAYLAASGNSTPGALHDSGGELSSHCLIIQDARIQTPPLLRSTASRHSTTRKTSAKP